MGRHTPGFRARARMEHAAQFVTSAVGISVNWYWKGFWERSLYLLHWFLTSHVTLHLSLHHTMRGYGMMILQLHRRSWLGRGTMISNYGLGALGRYSIDSCWGIDHENNLGNVCLKGRLYLYFRLFIYPVYGWVHFLIKLQKRLFLPYIKKL